MRKILVPLLISVLMCVGLCGCENKKVDSFLCGGIWEAVMQHSEDSDAYLLAYQFKNDGTYVVYNNLIVTSAGYFEHDGEELKLISPDRTQSNDLTVKYDEESKVLTLTGKVSVKDDAREISIKFQRIDEADEKYYKESNTTKIEVKKE